MAIRDGVGAVRRLLLFIGAHQERSFIGHYRLLSGFLQSYLSPPAAPAASAKLDRFNGTLDSDFIFSSQFHRKNRKELLLINYFG